MAVCCKLILNFSESFSKCKESFTNSKMYCRLHEAILFEPPSVHYADVIMIAMASQIISLTIVYSTIYSVADQRKHQSSASLAFVRGIHRWPVNSPHKRPVTRKMFPLHDVIMFTTTDEKKLSVMKHPSKSNNVTLSWPLWHIEVEQNGRHIVDDMNILQWKWSNFD